MNCKFCGAEFEGALVQCPECGMPTENFKVPVPAAVKAKKAAKKVDPDKIPANKPAIVSLIIDVASFLIAYFGGILALGAWGFNALLTSTGFDIFEALAGITYIAAIVIILIGVAVSVAGMVFAIISKFKKKADQKLPTVSLCFSLLTIINSCAVTALYLAYALKPLITLMETE